MQKKPQTFFVTGIIGLFLFLPTALLALVFSLQVNSVWDDGNIEMAKKYSKWAMVCTILTYAIAVVEILFIVHLSNA